MHDVSSLNHNQSVVLDVQSNSVEHKAQSLSQRVQAAAFRALFFGVWGILAILGTVTVIPAAYVISKRVLSHYKMKTAIQAMAVNRYNAVRKFVDSCIIPSLKELTLYDLREEFGNHPRQLNGDESLKRKYVLGVIELLEMLRSKQAPQEDCHVYMQEFRGKLDALLRNPIYELNKHQKDNFYIKVLQEASHALVAESPGMLPMQTLGSEFSGSLKEELDYSSFAGILQKAVDTHAEFKNNSKIEKAFWAISHPQRAFAACSDAIGVEKPTMYNSFRYGNASIHVGTFKVGKVIYSLSQSPTFTCDRVTEAARDRGDKRIYQDIEELQGPRGERKRVNAKKAAADGDLRGPRGKILHVHTPIDVHGEAKAHSFDLDRNLARAVESALGDNEPAKAVAFAALKGLQTMVDQAGIVGEGTVYLNQSCKQNIDRGVAVNVATILLADAISGKELTKSRVHQLVGMVLTRPMMVDDRAILEKRLTPLLDLLNAMQEDPGLLTAIQSHFGSRSISFMASSE